MIGSSSSKRKTGDGVGITTDIPVRFFRDELKKSGINLPGQNLYAVAQLFLPKSPSNPIQIKEAISQVLAQHVARTWIDLPDCLECSTRHDAGFYCTRNYCPSALVMFWHCPAELFVNWWCQSFHSLQKIKRTERHKMSDKSDRLKAESNLTKAELNDKFGQLEDTVVKRIL